MTVDAVGSGSGSNASQIAALQRQLQKDVATEDQDVAAGADQQTLQLDQLQVQLDQQQIQSLQQARAQQQAQAAERSATPTQGGTNSAVQPGTAAEDGSVYL